MFPVGRYYSCISFFLNFAPMMPSVSYEAPQARPGGCLGHLTGSPKAWHRKTPVQGLKSPSQPRFSLVTGLAGARVGEFGVQTSARNLPKLSLPLAGTPQKAQ